MYVFNDADTYQYITFSFFYCIFCVFTFHSKEMSYVSFNSKNLFFGDTFETKAITLKTEWQQH